MRRHPAPAGGIATPARAGGQRGRQPGKAISFAQKGRALGNVMNDLGWVQQKESALSVLTCQKDSVREIPPRSVRPAGR